MTSNMIAFRKYEEDVRHNREMERLTGEQQAEAVRHNKTVEEETVRSNVRNEQIKQQQNVINDNHYQRSDFETARSHGISELYTLQYPYAYGQTEANVAKTKSEATLNTAKVGESKAKATESLAKAGEAQARVEVLGTEASLNSVKTRDTLAGITLKQLQSEKTAAETRLINTRNAYYPSESITSSVSRTIGAGAQVLNAVSNLIHGGKRR